MAGSPLHRLFNLGAVGTMTDAQLLDRFVSRRDEAAEAAFEELAIRHGPMVLRVCRGVLHDPHDAEDAFQAVFLVLASRAGTVRRSGSVASWLFGVAHRVATRARRSAARRHRHIQLIAERAAESDLPREIDPEWEVLHEEIDGLPERLRAPVVLCYLQGQTYAAAAQQLGVSEIAIRGRLARARERLRHRLTRRGVTVPAGLLVAGAAGQAQAAVPMSLVHSTVRIALGFAAGNTAAVLARGVLNAMLLHQVKVAVVLLCLGIGGGYWTWHALAGAADEKGQAGPGTTVARTPASTKPSTVAQKPAFQSTYTYPITITGQAFDPDGKPVPGATIYLASRRAAYKRIGETVTDAEGRYAFRDVPLPIERATPNAVGGRDEGSFQVFGEADGFGFAWRPQKWFFPLPKPPSITYEPEFRDPPSRYEANDKIELNLRFSSPARLAGTVVDDRGTPRAGVRLEIRDCESLTMVDNVIPGWTLDALNEHDSAPPSMKIRTTDASGRFAFTGLPANSRFRIDIRAEGFPWRRFYAATTPEPQPDHDGGPVYTGDFKLTLSTPVDVPIKMVFADTGQPASKVAVQAAGGLVNTLQTTDDQGRTTLKLPPGSYRMENVPARGTPYLVTEDKLVVEAKPPAEPVVRSLRPAAIVEVTVVDAETGAGLSNVDLWEQPGPGPQRQRVFFRSWEVATRIAWVESPRTDAHGKLRVLVEPGKHRFGAGWEFRPPFYTDVEPQGREVECRAGETVRLKFAMRRRR
jgi:RNA polymerase sigma factor (sigma-70 family)